MTSANLSDEPIAYTDEDARTRLAEIADRFCTHDRPIHTRTDDSVLRALDPAVRPEPLIMRRSRGWVPGSLPLPFESLPPAARLRRRAEEHLLPRPRRPRLGLPPHRRPEELRDPDLLPARASSTSSACSSSSPSSSPTTCTPTTCRAATRSPARASSSSPSSITTPTSPPCSPSTATPGPAVGAIYDGSGYGPDGTVWGGELLVGGLDGYERAGLLFPVRLPGGDKAVQEPWRMACAWLAAAVGEKGAPEQPPAPLAGLVEPNAWTAIAEMCRTGLASPLTTSAGRLFDAVAALCGLRGRVSYEGQAAIELEALAAAAPRPAAAEIYPMPLVDEQPGPLLIDARETVRAIVADLAAGVDAAQVSARFHAAFAAATVEALARTAERHGLERVVLSGGVFQNRLLLERVVARSARAPPAAADPARAAGQRRRDLLRPGGDRGRPPRPGG